MAILDVYEILGRAYGAAVTKTGDIKKIASEFKAKIAADPEFAAAARQRRASLEAFERVVGARDFHLRDFVGARQLEFLRANLD